MLDFIHSVWGEKAELILAGALGGVVRWLRLREGLRDGTISILVGSICAAYLGPLALPAVEPIIGRLVIDPAARVGFSGFIIGLGGIALAGIFIDLWSGRAQLWTSRSARDAASTQESTADSAVRHARSDSGTDRIHSGGQSRELSIPSNIAAVDNRRSGD